MLFRSTVDTDITAVDSPDTFERPIGADNAVGIVQSPDAIKVVTVRTSAFDPVTTVGGAASVLRIDGGASFEKSRFSNRQMKKFDHLNVESVRDAL